MTTTFTLRIGTRKSPLATWQAEYVASQLQSHGFSVELVPITTSGDVLQGSLAQAGGAGLFTKEIQRALLDNRCDIAVHSLKDLPTEPIEGLGLAAVPMREDPSDCLVAREARSLETLPPGAVVGTGSPRRRAQLAQRRPDLTLSDIRGNVDTRLKKLSSGEFDAIVLALAGLRRLGLEHSVSETLSLDTMLPAVGQGALGLETRVDDARSIDAVRTLDHAASHMAVHCEREVLRQLRAGCLAPVAAHARWVDDEFTMSCRVYSRTLDRCVTAHHAVGSQNPRATDPGLTESMIGEIMRQLIAQDAIQIVSDSRT
ncbi:MAG: hydroxymethylbilane synthase [Planctomycetota bacterium]|jgi:hydroxymethylbilane synthase